MSLLRRSLEDGNEDKTVLLKGPLSDVYTQALAIAYSKETPTDALPDSGNISVESQANDSIVQAAIIRAISGGDTVDTNSATTVYGVSQNSLTQNDVVEIVNLIKDNESNPDNLIIVVDSGDSEDTTKFVDISEISKELTSAIEHLGAAYHVPVTHSLQDALKLL